MAKQLTITHEGKKYVLEFTRNSVREMERRGFNVREVESKPITMLPALFEGAFLAHHKFVKPDVIDAIYKKMGNKDDLVGKLAEMYSEPIEALFEEPDENDEGNATWEANW